MNDSYDRWYKGRDCGPRSDPEIGGHAPRGISEGAVGLSERSERVETATPKSRNAKRFCREYP